jgi:two-component system, OmpR family, copper resistance phosphate regulon response regulator CusR
MKILIIEDDPSIAEMLQCMLTADTHAVDVAENGNDGSFMARTYEYDLIILDHALPGKNGITVCKDIRGIGKMIPILFLSVTHDPKTKVLALDSGADDYMTKPFSISELRARIKALTRRAPIVTQNILSLHDLVLDPSLHQAVRGETKISLTKKEFALLEYMLRNKSVILSRANLMEHVWNADSDPFSNTVEAHIRNLRKKINGLNFPNLIANIPGHGYIIDTPEKLLKLNR